MEINKENKYQRVINSTLALFESHGINNMSMSLIAKHSQVSRSWIYKYIANNLDGVQTFCLKSFIDEFSRFADISSHQTKEELINSLTSFSLVMMERIREKPLIMRLYFSNCTLENLVGNAIKMAEQKYIQILANNISVCASINPKDAMLKAEFFHSMRMGVLLLYLKKLEDLKIQGWEEEFLKEFKFKVNLIISQT